MEAVEWRLLPARQLQLSRHLELRAVLDVQDQHSLCKLHGSYALYTFSSTQLIIFSESDDEDETGQPSIEEPRSISALPDADDQAQMPTPVL